VKTWTQLALSVLAAGVLFAVTFAYSRRLGDAWLAQLEIDELERIPTLAEER
jgi:hypothetical protein